MKIAVTGATGFLGNYVLRELSKYDHEIIAIHRKSTHKIEKFKNLTFENIDISKQYCDLFTKLQSPDLLIHLAWEGLPNYKSLHHFEKELPIQYNFIKTLVEAGLKSIFITGTCFEYGNKSGQLSTEINTEPINPYGFAKDSLRKELEFLKKFHDFNFIWARLFYLYGEGQSQTSLYTSLKKAVERGDEIFNMSGGEQIRDFLPVETVAKNIVDIALNIKNSETINICSGVPISVRSLVEKWIDENNWKIKLNRGFYPYPDYEPMCFWGLNHM